MDLFPYKIQKLLDGSGDTFEKVDRATKLWSYVRSFPPISCPANLIISVARNFEKPAATYEPCVQLIKDALQACMPEISSCKRGYPPRIVEALGILCVSDDKFLSAVSRRIKSEEPDLAGHHLAKLAFGFAELNFQDAELIDRLITISEAADQWKGANNRSKFVSSLALICDSEQFRRASLLFDQHFQEHGLGDIDLNALRRLQNAVYIHDAAEYLSSGLLGQLKNVSRIPGRGAQPTPSELAKLVGEIVRSQGYDVQFEVPINGYYVDMTAQKKGSSKIIIESDGVMFHYINGSPTDGLRGSHKFRDRILEKSGYQVKRIVQNLHTGTGELIESIREALESVA